MAKDKIIQKLVVIGGSAGSLDVLLLLCDQLPVLKDVSIVVILHRKNQADSTLTDLLSYKTNMPVYEVEDKDELKAGQIYVAPADYHLLFEDENTFSLDSSEKLNYSRPSIDMSFQSAAEVFGNRVIGLLLSGANADGTEGMRIIHEHGGYTIAQDPATATVGFMPQQAIDLGIIQKIAQPGEMQSLIVSLIQQV